MAMKTAPVSFDNTEIAFAHLPDKELKEAFRLFSLLQKKWLVTSGTRLIPWLIRAGLPVKGLIRKTIYKQFVGGETLGQTAQVAQKLAASNVQVILDYGVEGKEGEAAFDNACSMFVRVIGEASQQPNIPFISVKVTGLARMALLEKLDGFMHRAGAVSLPKRYGAALRQLSAGEKTEWQKVETRLRKIGDAAGAKNIGMLVDAEESWIQDPVDALTLLLMNEYNKSRAVVFNTVQLYRYDRMEFLTNMLRAAEEDGFVLGVKLVRGAYMEKERKRALEKGYLSPIQKDKPATDAAFNEAVQTCTEHISRTVFIVASHNEASNLLAVQLLLQKGLPLNHPHVHFSQLYGMSDHITFNLARSGCNVSKYVPFGPIQDVIPYLMRRAQENMSVQGQTARELNLIRKELERRERE
jgi:proline dehydrogenase